MLICISNPSGVSHDGQYIHQINKLVSIILAFFIVLSTASTVSKVEFETDLLPSETIKVPPRSPTTPQTPSSRPSRLNRFLNDLAIRPNDPPHDLDDPSLRSGASETFGSAPSLASLSASTSTSTQQITNSARNPESDSFAYIETLLESLAVLGKLGSALDTVAQRLPGEIFTLVDMTLDEVAERAEYGRRGSVIMAGGTTSRSDGAYIFSSGIPGHGGGIGSTVAPKGGLLGASSLRLATLESSAKWVDHETLKDFFWTVYSKLDAVSQGLRVVFEVSNRIGSVSPNY